MKDFKPWDARKFSAEQKELLNDFWAKLEDADKSAVRMLMQYAASKVRQEIRSSTMF